MSALDCARSFLFFPGGDDRKLRRACAIGADAIVYDLEDGVGETMKDTARDGLPTFFEAASRATKLVRVNSLGSSHALADLAALAALPTLPIVVPKAEDFDSLKLGRPVIALIETAAGVANAWRIASLSNVVALALGTADLSTQLGLHPDPDGRPLLLARSTLVLASAAAAIRPPVDGPCLSVAGADELRKEAEIARSLGLHGKICIHPSQIEVVHRVFAPSDQEREWATGVLDAWNRRDAASAVTVSGGTLVDRPVVMRARRIMDLSERSVR